MVLVPGTHIYTIDILVCKVTIKRWIKECILYYILCMLYLRQFFLRWEIVFRFWLGPVQSNLQSTHITRNRKSYWIALKITTNFNLDSLVLRRKNNIIHTKLHPTRFNIYMQKCKVLRQFGYCHLWNYIRKCCKPELFPQLSVRFVSWKYI